MWPHLPQLRVISMPASRRRRGSGSARSFNSVMSPQLRKGIPLIHRRNEVTELIGDRIKADVKKRIAKMATHRRRHEFFGGLWFSCAGTSCATYRSVNSLEDWDIYYPYFESEADVLLGSDTTATSLTSMDSLLPSNIRTPIYQYHETAYIPAAERCFEHGATTTILPGSALSSTTSSCSTIVWSEVGDSDKPVRESTEYFKRTAGFLPSLYDIQMIRLYKCPHF